jgi:hypothetical protein
VHESVKSLYERHKDKARPSVAEILKVCHAVVADYSRTFIVIDALDECQVSGEFAASYYQSFSAFRPRLGQVSLPPHDSSQRLRKSLKEAYYWRSVPIMMCRDI